MLDHHYVLIMILLVINKIPKIELYTTFLGLLIGEPNLFPYKYYGVLVIDLILK